MELHRPPSAVAVGRQLVGAAALDREHGLVGSRLAYRGGVELRDDLFAIDGSVLFQAKADRNRDLAGIAPPVRDFPAALYLCAHRFDLVLRESCRGVAGYDATRVG